MVHALLTTGRKLDQIAGINFRLIGRGADVASAPSGLLKRQGKWNWWLPAGGPERREIQASPAMLPTCPNLWLPVSAAVRPLIDRCLKKRGLQPHAGPQPLFLTPPHTLKRRVLAILTSRPAGAPKARRSATTVESAERWLLRQIAQTAGGDVGAASLITGRTQTLARPMTYYGALSIPQAISIHERATRRADRHDHDEFPTSLAGLSIGDPDTPKDASVRSLIVRLAADLQGPARNLTAAHGAMTRYTCALLAFALALRGRGTLPSFSAVDVRTGFCQVHDKFRGDPTHARLLWIPQVALEQMRLYDAHLQRLSELLGPAAREWLTRSTSQVAAAAPLFSVLGDDRIEPVELRSVLLGMQNAGWPGRENAGRHWLRSKLSGRCSGETLGAFFGHWQKGVDPWAATSALDPLVYRADLQHSLDPILQKAEWRPRASPLAPS